MKYTAESTGFPPVVWLGMKSGERPIFAFAEEHMARAWAAETDRDARIRYVVGPIQVPPSSEARKALKVPATSIWDKEA